MIKKDEIIEETATVPTSFNKKKSACKTQNFHILLAFLLIPIVLLIAVSIIFYLTTDQAKQKYFLLFYITNDKSIKIENNDKLINVL